MQSHFHKRTMRFLTAFSMMAGASSALSSLTRTSISPSSLLKVAASVRSKLPPHQRDAPPDPSNYQSLLSYPSTYLKRSDENGRHESSDDHLRGFCNWILPDLIMVGQYPGQNPEINGPSSEEVAEHIRSVVVDAGVRTFCCLQSEVPAQTDDIAWKTAQSNGGGGVYLDGYARSMWPRPFTWYAPLVRSALADAAAAKKKGGDGADNDASLHVSNAEASFLHVPITDLTVPESSDEFYGLLHDLLAILDEDQEDQITKRANAVYLHCWGGRGRAGLVGSCLLSLIYPELDARAVLHLVQKGYDSREGAEQMPDALSKSPQTADQRDFVRKFVAKIGRSNERR